MFDTILKHLIASVLVAALSVAHAYAADYPTPVEGDYVVKGFRFADGEILSELKLHYRTVGGPRRDAQGRVVNAVLILQRGCYGD